VSALTKEILVFPSESFDPKKIIGNDSRVQV
jgi:hypothetical protein